MNFHYIPYDPKADPWYQFGNLVGNGLSTMATNRDIRGVTKDLDNEYVAAENKKVGQRKEGLQAYMNALQSGNVSQDELARMRYQMQNQNHFGGYTIGADLDTLKGQIADLDNQSQYLSNYGNANQGLWLHDKNYQKGTDYVDAYKGLSKLM